MFEVNEISEHNEMCGGYSYDFEVTTNCKTVGELIKEIEQENAKEKNDGYHTKYSWAIYKLTNSWNALPLHIGSYWGTDSRDHSKYDNEKIIKTYGQGGWYCPIEIVIVI